MARRVGGVFKAAGLLTGTAVLTLVVLGVWVVKGIRNPDDD
jgi:hypothetical protein